MFIKVSKLDDREYQRNIFESAKDRNTLVILPTGLGKTMISILVADYRLTKFPGSKILFMAPTKPLINQHYRTFVEFTTINIGIVSGMTPKEKRKEIYKNSQLIFATPQTIENDIKDDTLDLSDFSSLIVDEAHHSIGNYAYVYVAKEYIKRSKYPHILALTASPASDKEKILTICRNLSISNIEIRSESDPDVIKYIKTKLIEEIQLDMPDYISSLISDIKFIIADNIEKLRSIGLLKEVSNSKITRRLILMLQKNLQAQMARGNRSIYVIRGIITTSKLLKMYYLLDLVSTQSLLASKRFLDRIINGKSTKSDIELSKDQSVINLLNKIDGLLGSGMENPKINEVKRILMNEISGEKKAIIFTQYRDNVDAIFDNIKSLNGIRPVKFIGQGKNGLSQKEQVDIIKDFESGVYNVLVSTSISEEGISIKGVDLAIFYETIPSAIRSIQRRGRVGRYNIGKIYILIIKGTTDQGYYWVSRQRENKMKRMIKTLKNDPDMIKFDGTLNPFT